MLQCVSLMPSCCTVLLSLYNTIILSSSTQQKIVSLHTQYRLFTTSSADASSCRDVNRYAPPELNLLMLPLQLNSITQILDAVPTGRCYGLSSEKRVNFSTFNLPCTDYTSQQRASCHVTVTSLYTWARQAFPIPFLR